MLNNLSAQREIEERYNRNLPIYESLGKEVEERLKYILEENYIKYHYVTYRVKTFDSFRRKIVRHQIKNPFEEINDILGVRIVCVFRSDLERIDRIIRKNFEIIDFSKKLEDVEFDRFGYMSNHYVIKEIRYDFQNRKGINYELQVRTILMDAWASISHHLDYKKDIDIPNDLKKDFYALSGLLYSADTQFEMLKNGREKYVRQTMESFIHNGLQADIELNLDNVKAYLDIKFPEDPISDMYIVTIIKEALERDNVKDFSQLDHILNVTKEARSDAELESEFTHMHEFYTISHITDALMLFDPSNVEHHLFAHPGQDKQFVLKKALEKYENLRKKYNLEQFPDL